MSQLIPFFIGTYTEPLGHVTGRGPGIVPCSLDSETGAFEVTGAPKSVRNPAYLWRNPKGTRLYATSEIYDFQGRADGCITAFEMAPSTGHLTKLSESSSAGSGPAWIHGDQTGQWLLVANYVQGNVAVFRLNQNGTPGEPSAVVGHSGGGPIRSRQEGPHPHSVLASPDNRHVYAADLGTDTIHGYQFERGTGNLEASQTASLKLPPGTGPRHLLFHPKKPLLFVVLELSSEVALLNQEASDGSLTQEGCWSTLPGSEATANHPSELVLTRDCRFLYVANRGQDSIAIFTAHPESGTLELIGSEPCGGVTPRHLALSPNQEFLVVANQDSDGVAVFRRDRETGQLKPAGDILPIPTPCFICF